MDFIDGKNLKACLRDINQEDIWHYVSQLADAARHLDDLGYVHRDIKPENIMINQEDKKLTLMDLGVVKLVQGAALTDSDGISHFIGTLQYSSPEYLLRNEEDTPEGWMALTFYQIGAVLHDMIMQIPIFKDECEPYGRLVVAVRDTNPVVESSAVDRDLIHLAQCCLLKSPEQRLAMLNWESFYQTDEPTTAKARVSRRIQWAKIKTEANTASIGDEEIKNELKHRVIDVLKSSARLIVVDNGLLLKIEVTSNNDNEVTLAINSNPEIGIKNKFTIVAKLEIVSAISEAISVGFSTQNNKKSIIQKGVIFKGIYNKDKLYQGYERAMYESIESIIQEDNHGYDMVVTKW